MSNECEQCGEHIVDCICDYKSNGKYILKRTCGKRCPCNVKSNYTHLNLVRNSMNKNETDLSEGVDPPSEIPDVRYVNARGREEHETIIKDSSLCKELGLDQIYETIIYLKRWGGWLIND